MGYYEYYARASFLNRFSLFRSKNYFVKFLVLKGSTKTLHQDESKLYPQRMRLQIRLYGISSICFL